MSFPRERTSIGSKITTISMLLTIGGVLFLGWVLAPMALAGYSAG